MRGCADCTPPRTCTFHAVARPAESEAAPPVVADVDALRAENARLKAELASLKRLSAMGWDVTEVGVLKAQIRDRDKLLKNENELYRQATERADGAEQRCSEWRLRVEELEREVENWREMYHANRDAGLDQ